MRGTPRTARTSTALGALFAAFAAAACSDADAGPAAPPPKSAATTEAPRPAVDDSAVRRLIAEAGSGKSTTRDPALVELAAGGDAARRAAEGAIAADAVPLRRGGARALERLADAGSVGALAAALARRDPIEEDVLVRTLARVATADAGRALVATVLGADPRRALLAGKALADFAGPFDADALRAAARADGDFHVREAALLAIGGHAAAPDRALFEAASRDATAPIRAASVRGLFSFEPVATADLRRLMLDDPEAMVRRTAAREALRVRGDDVVAVLLSAAGEFDETVAGDAVETLAKRSEPTAFDALLEVVRDDSRSPHLRGVAAQHATASDRGRTVAMLKRESAIFDLETRAYCDEILSAEGRR